MAKRDRHDKGNDDISQADKDITKASKGESSDKATKALADWAKDVQKGDDK